MTAYTPSLFDLPAAEPVPAAPFARRSETSRAAAVAVTPGLPSREASVLAYIKGCGKAGATDWELFCHFVQRGWPESGTRPRRVRLVQVGLIVDSGRTRKTGTGRAATVWVAREI